MEMKIYGAPRLMDWVAQIKVGAATVRVHFTGGSLTVYGVTPAEYKTADPFIQKAIETSRYFKEGRITLVKSIPVKTEQKTVKDRKVKGCQSTAPKTKPVDSKTEAVPRQNCPTSEESAEAESEDTSSPAEIESSQDSEPNELQEVEVSCLQDAQDYLQQTFGIPSYKVRSYDAAQKAAVEHGVVFVGGKFVSPGNLPDEDADEDSDEE